VARPPHFHVSRVFLHTVKTLKAIAVLALAGSLPVAWHFVKPPDASRSAGPPPGHTDRLEKLPDFDSRQSAALFVGVREFSDKDMIEVPYAVDDAIDQAYAFVLSPNIRLVPPNRTILAIAGAPQKPESAQRLSQLREAGVKIHSARTDSDLIKFLQKQSTLAGPAGIMIASFASHGFTQDGHSYVLASDSTFDQVALAVPLLSIFDIVAQSKALRSLVLIDACRDRIDRNRAGSGDERTRARLMEKTQGQVIFYAAASGQYAYDDPVHRNGVFTKALLDGLQCGAAGKIVTASTLHTFVERRVRAWLKENHKPVTNPATQFSFEGRALNMPLAGCSDDPPWSNPTRVAIKDRLLTVYEKDDVLWHQPAAANSHATIADLNGDERNEVLFGDPNGTVTAFDADQKKLWSADAQMRVPMALHALFATRFRSEKGDSVIALWRDPTAKTSRLAAIDANGRFRTHYDFPSFVTEIFLERQSGRSDPRVIATTADSFFIFKPKSLQKPEFHEEIGRIKSLAVEDQDGDGDNDIVLKTARGSRMYDFNGNAPTRNAKKQR